MEQAPTSRRTLARLLDFRPRELLALAALALVVVAGAAFAFVRALPRAEPSATPSPGVAIQSGSPLPGARLYVHVAGAVNAPGVYEFDPGARVADALRAAGGPAGDADADAINLARPLQDGERLYVPRRGEASAGGGGGGGAGIGGGGSGSSGSSGGKVNINTATVAELDTLPGIGPALAQRIVDYREQHGPFRSVRDLLKVEGIGEKKLEGLEDYVTV